jgi:hypothetical protein
MQFMIFSELTLFLVTTNFKANLLVFGSPTLSGANLQFTIS